MRGSQSVLSLPRAHARRTRSRRLFRHLTHEQLEVRQMLMADLTSEALPQAPLAAPTQQWFYRSEDAQRESLANPGFADEQSDLLAEESFVFVHPLERIPLAPLFAQIHLSSERVGREPWVSNPAVFQVPPTVTDAGELMYRVSGKPGFQGSSTIILWNDDPTHPYPLGQFQVEVNNGITTTESVAAQERDNQANISADLNTRAESLFARQADPAPDGEEDPPIEPPPSPSTPPPPSPSTTPAHLTLAAPDSTAEEPHFIYCGTVNTDGKFTITSDSAWLGGNVQIAVTGGAHLGNDYTLSSVAGLSFAPNGNGGGLLTVTLPPYATAPVVEIVVTAKKDNFEVDTPETVQFSWHDTDTATVIHHGSGSTVTISDFLEGLSLTADSSTTSEVTSPPATFHIQPQTSGCTLCTNATLWIDASGTGDATPGVDYVLQTETGASITLSETSPGSKFYTSNSPIQIANDADFQIKVFALTDSLVAGQGACRSHEGPV